MKSKILGLLAVGMLAAPTIATANVVTWHFSGIWVADAPGVLNATSGTAKAPLVSMPAIGSAFGLSMEFDTNAVLLGDCFSNTNCKQYEPLGLKFELTSPSCSGGKCVSSADGSGALSDGNRSVILVGNDSNLPGPSLVDTNDVLNFLLYDANGIQWRGLFSSGDTSVFSNTSLPSNLDPRLLPGTFVMCNPLPGSASGCGGIGTPNFAGRVSDYRLWGTITAAPEPGTLALLGLGLAGLGLSRRRKVN